MELTVGSIVKRIEKDNYPDCKVGDVGVICAETAETRGMFGLMSQMPIPMILVRFGNGRPCPNIVKYLKLIY